jgi:hypothetical protein
MKTIPTRCLQVAASAATLMFGWTGAVCADSDASGRAAGQLPVSQIQKIMTSPEVVPVVKLMLNKLGWYQGCLYNQETNEYPQLFFDHMLKRGNAYTLAAEIRQGLNLTGAR